MASDPALSAAPAVAPWALRALFSTCSIRVLTPHIKRDYFDRGGKGFVGVVWHKDFIFAVDYFRRRGHLIMVSRSRDGEIVARVLHRLGYRTVRGSSSAGGAAALREITRSAPAGAGIALVADGPRGPARRAKLGCVLAARESGRPLIALGCHMAPALDLGGWARPRVPLPFASIAVAFGEPIHVPSDASREECEQIRERVDAVMADVERMCRAAIGTP